MPRWFCRMIFTNTLIFLKHAFLRKTQQCCQCCRRQLLSEHRLAAQATKSAKCKKVKIEIRKRTQHWWLKAMPLEAEQMSILLVPIWGVNGIYKSSSAIGHVDACHVIFFRRRSPFGWKTHVLMPRVHPARGWAVDLRYSNIHCWRNPWSHVWYSFAWLDVWKCLGYPTSTSVSSRIHLSGSWAEPRRWEGWHGSCWHREFCDENTWTKIHSNMNPRFKQIDMFLVVFLFWRVG